METKNVLEVILEIARSTKYAGPMLNERYLHHFFSYLLQHKYDSLNLNGDSGKIILHPEWPTYKKQTGLFYGRYKGEKGRYRPDAKGTAGFIDFAIGNYKNPDIGIEFSLKYGWSNEEVVYDFLKLLDKKNPFNTSISFNVVFRQGRLPKGRSLRNLEEHMNEAFRDAVNRLGNEGYDESREIHFIITEIDKENKRRHWYYDSETREFKKGLPVIA